MRIPSKALLAVFFIFSMAAYDIQPKAASVTSVAVKGPYSFVSGNDRYVDYLLGAMHYFGEGRDEDHDKAKYHLEKSMNTNEDQLGRPDAIGWSLRLGTFYFEQAELILSGQVRKQSSVIKSVVSPDSTRTASLINSSVPDLDIEDRRTTRKYLEITTDKRRITIVADEIIGDGWVESFEFFGNNFLIVVLGTHTYSTTFLLDLEADTPEMQRIAQGQGKIVTTESGASVVKVTWQKHYFPAPQFGAFWVDALYDLSGNLIGFVSVPEDKRRDTCVPIKEIVDVAKYPKLEQGPDDCVFVY